MAPIYPKQNLTPVGKKIDTIFTQRLDQFTNPKAYKNTNLASVLVKDSVDGADHIKYQVSHVPGLDRPLFRDYVKTANFEPAKVGDTFGPSWSTHWFKVEIKIPEKWANEPVIMLNWNCGNEGLIFDQQGEAVVGLSKGDRQEWILPKELRDGEWHTFYIETSCNALFGNAPDTEWGIGPPTPDKYYTLEAAQLFVPNLEARALKRDFEVIHGCVKAFDDKSWQRHRALEVATQIIDVFRSDDPSSITRGREIAQKFIGEHVDSNKVFTSNSTGQVYAVGHCHIDTAWLWPYAETRRKIGRSWASQLELIERYPEYNFMCSQAVQYLWLKQDYPDLFERVKKQAKLGRFVPIGGSWVESDTNMPSGESIARQFLYGQRFFEQNFGERCKTFWLPDTFGYQAQIPQLCRGAEMERFVTIKLSWNNINKFPHSTFNWVALDGSQVLCHMPPSDNYNANCHMDEIMMCTTNNKSVDVTEKSLLLFGIGDGGGGPTEDMLEYLRRARGVSDNVGLLPTVSMNANVDAYFDEIIEETKGGKQIATWLGELYFEFHRGTYTTEAGIKYANRKSEVLLHDLELLATVASIKIPGYKYPKAEFDTMWQLVLLIQFHDVLPGSAIEMAYDEARDYFAEIKSISDKVFKGLSSAIDGKSSGSVRFLNTLPWSRSEVAEIDAESVKALGDVTVQKSYKQGKSIVAIQSCREPALMEPKKVDNAIHATAKEVKTGVFVLENASVKVTIENGLITSIIDKKNDREVIAEGGNANKFCIFDDKPLFWEGWDTEVYSLNTKAYISEGTASILETGPLRASVIVEQKISNNSWLKSVISLSAVDSNSDLPSYVQFDTEVEWREDSKFLKVEFPVDVFTEEATYDSMYGAVRRPTHFNTSWDMAKFEVCCHKYADLSDHGYGVTIINESKYGFATHGNTMRLSLLRSSKAPDGNADMGRHHIRYALQPHSGTLSGKVVRTAWNYNHDLLALDVPRQIIDNLAPISYQGPDNIIISAIKRAEDDADVSTDSLPKRNTKSIVVRVFDSLGGKSRGYLVSQLAVKRAFKTNLLEDDKEEMKASAENGVSKIEIKLNRFEIASYRLELV